MMNIFIDNVKILVIFIFVDLLITMLLMAVTGASFVMMNSITFKLVAALLSIFVTAAGYTIYEHKKLKK